MLFGSRLRLISLKFPARVSSKFSVYSGRLKRTIQAPEEIITSSTIKKQELEKIRRKNKAVVVYSAGKIALVTRPLRVIKEDEVLIKMGGVVVSDTDAQLITYGSLGRIRLKWPIVIGGHGAGIVLATFGNTKLLKSGDRVVIDPWSYCGSCQNCTTGNPTKCRLHGVRGVPPSSGLTSQFLSHPVDFVQRIPSSMTMIEAAFVPIVARCLQAYEKAALSRDSNLVVFGTGILGLTMIKVSRSLGINRVFATDNSLYRLDLAKRVGSDFILELGFSAMSGDFAGLVTRALGDLPDVVYSTSLAPVPLKMAVQLAKPGGIIILPRLSGGEFDLSLSLAVEKKLTIFGNWECGNLMTRALILMTKGVIKVDFLKPVIFPMEQSIDAFSAARANLAEHMAVFIRCNESVR